MKRIGIVAGTLGLATVMSLGLIGGIVDAQTSTPSGTSTTTSISKKDQFLGTLAGKLGVTTGALQTAIEQTAAEVGFGPGRIGERWRERIQERAQQHRDQLIGHLDLAPAAAFLGISEDQLESELQGDKPFIDIARAHGKTDDQIRAFLIQRATATIDERLQSSDSDTTPTT